MDECINLMNRFSTKTLRELNKKGFSVVDPQGNNVTSINDIVLGESGSNYQIPDKHLLCNARVWNKGYGGRCSKVKNADSDICYQHTKIKAKYGDLLFGKYNDAFPTKYPYYYKKSGKTIQWKTKKPTSVKKPTLPITSANKAASKIQAFVRKTQKRKNKNKKKTVVKSKPVTPTAIAKPLSPSELKKFNRPKQTKRPRKTQKKRSKPTSVKTSDYEDI